MREKLPILAGVTTLAIAAAIRLDLSEWLRGGCGWRWPYEALDLARILPLAIVMYVYLIGAWLLLRHSCSARYVVSWSGLGTFVIAISAVAAREGDVLYALFARTASRLGTGPHWVAAHIDWSSGAWRNWAAQVTALGGHLSNLPPGSALWYAFLSSAFDQFPQIAATVQRALMPFQCHNYDLLTYTAGQWASTLFGMAMPLWAALTPTLLYAIARRIVAQNARAAVLWYPLIPALSSFVATWNTLLPLIATLAFLALLIGCERARPRIAWCILSGFITGLGWFVNFALVPLALFIGIWVLIGEWLVKRRALVQCMQIGVFYSVGLSIVWLVFGLASGQTLFDLLAASMSFHLSLDRPYLFWLFMHPWDWLLWNGIAFGIVTIAQVAKLLRKADRSAFPTVSVSLMLTILILVISGTARGETGRVWLFFAPFLLIGAAEHESASGRSAAETRWLWLGVPQGLLVVALVSSIASMSTDFTPPPPAPQVVTTRAADALFIGDTGRFRLIGWDAEIANGALHLRLNWQGIEPSLAPIWFGGALVNRSGAALPLAPWQPSGASHYPTTCWSSGAAIGTTHTAELGSIAPGEWWLSLAAYGDSAQPDRRLRVWSQAGEDSQIGLGPITITSR
jgi:hypothetical protein